MTRWLTEYAVDEKLSNPLVPVLGGDPPAKKSTVMEPGDLSPVGTINTCPCGIVPPVMLTTSG